MSFYCGCGYQCLVKEQQQMLKHMDQCVTFPFYSELCQMMEKKGIWNLNSEELLILRSDLQLQIQRIDNILITKEDFGKESLNPPNLQQSISDQRIQCEFCKKEFQSNKEFDLVWYLENCTHIICKQCFAKKCIEDYIKNEGQLNCKCGQSFSRQEIIQSIGHEKLSELDQRLNLLNQNIVECSHCKEQFNFEKGNPNELVRDQNNKQIEGVMLDHYINNRFTCFKCNTEQCKTCKASPYHANMSCEDFKKREASAKCRLCENPTDINMKQTESHRNICKLPECQERAKTLCTKKLACGHFCQGSNQSPCLPCLNEKCAKDQNEDDYCNICFTEGLRTQTCVITSCGHIFHEICLKKKLDIKWNGPRIVFNFLQCPLCKSLLDVKNPSFVKLIIEGKTLLKEVEDLCLQRFKLEEREKDKEYLDPKNPFLNKPLEYSMHIYCYYECFKCKKPYFGGLKNCQAAAEQDNKIEFKKEDLVCTKCCPILTLEDKCKKHGSDFIDFKCRHCCAIALWFCHGTTHYCDYCHRNIKSNMTKVCPGIGKCPLGIPHKPNGQEMSLGCSLCRAERLKAT